MASTSVSRPRSADGRLATGVEVGELATHEVQAQGPELLGQRGVGPGRRRLALERADLALHLSHQVPETVEVLLGGGQPALGPLPTAAVLQDPGRLLDDGPPVLGTGVEDGPELTLAHDHVLLPARPRSPTASPGCRGAGTAGR